MKKIININLSGRVIPIEDSAYERLQTYIESLRRYFASEDGRDEIINDIESRIAELMSEKVRKGAACVTDADISEIIASMGTPADFDAAADEKTETAKPGNQQQYYYSEKKSKGRLYRDTSDKFVGGVCSGIAAYMNVDPAIVRILFAIITFGGFGLGFLIYILLWIVLPPKDLVGYSGKRLYRNPEDKVIGGVAGGLAAYFDKRASTVRLIFAAPIILSILAGIINRASWDYGLDVALNIGFGSLSGTFILIYIILWIVLPEANSDYEKMEMRGEKVDVNSIRQNVKDGMDNMKDRMKNWSEEVKESAQNIGAKAKEFSNTRGRAFASEVNETVRRRSGGIGHAIGVLFKVFFLFIAGTIAFALFVAVIALIFGGIAWWPVNNFLWTSKWQQTYAWSTLLFFLGVPLIGFITWLIRRILGVRSRNSYLGWTFGFLWTLGWVAAILLASSISKDFWEYEHQDTPIVVNQPMNGKMIVAVSQPALEYTGRFEWVNDGADGWDLSSDTLKLSTIQFNIKASIDSAYHVIMRKYGYGKTQREALTRADKIQYAVYSRDSILDLANGYTVDKESKFRGQQVEIEIQIPVGKKIRFDESVNDKLNPINFRVRRTIRRRRIVNIEIDNTYRSTHFSSGVDYIMDINGTLKDAAGNMMGSSNDTDDYRYNNNNPDKKSTIEEQRKKIEQEQERLKKMEEDEKNKEKQKIKTSLHKSKDDGDDDAVASIPSADGYSLIEWF